jgi:hypothetical protein
VKKVIEVPFGHPRPQLPELRGRRDFQEIRADIWSLIRSDQQDSRSDSPAGANS